MNINKATVAGHITNVIELKALPSGMHVANFSIATNRVWKDKDGQKQEESEFHNVVAYGKTAETVHKWFGKGSPIYIEGRMKTRSWDGEDGKKRYRTEVVMDSFQFVGSKNDRQSAPQEESAYSQDYSKPQSEQSGYDVIEYPDEDIDPADIPF